MATITPTLGTINPVGDHTVITGSFTGVDADNTIALVPTTGNVLSFSVSRPNEETAPEVVLNAVAGGAADTTQGSVFVNTASTGLYTFTAHVIGAI